MTNPTGNFVWYELISPDPDASKAFYDAVVGWTVEAPHPFSVVCFRHDTGGSLEESNAHNARILDAVNAEGDVFLSHTVLKGRYVIRVAIGNLRTERSHLARAWELLRQAAAGG